MTVPRRARRAVLILSGWAPLSLAGCLSAATRAPERSAVSEAMQIDVSAHRARLAAQSTEMGFLGIIELAADSVILASRDPMVARNALMWKANAIPVVQRALNHPDPLLSFVDGWTLIEQMRAYYGPGLGRDDFGEQQDIVVDALTTASERLDEGVRAELDPADYGRLRDFVHQWAADHPLDNRLLVREPVAQVAARALGGIQLGGLAALGRMEELAFDAQQMAQSYLSYTPKVLLWQAELMAADMLDTTRIAPLLQQVDRLAVMAAATRLMDELPGLVDVERRATLEGVSEITDDALADLIGMATTERQAVLREVAALVREERAALTDEVADALLQTIEAASREAIEVVDHTLWRVAQGAAVLLILFAIFQYLMFRAFLARPRAVVDTGLRS